MKKYHLGSESLRYSQFPFAHDLAPRAFNVAHCAIDIHPEVLVEK